MIIDTDELVEVSSSIANVCPTSEVVLTLRVPGRGNQYFVSKGTQVARVHSWPDTIRGGWEMFVLAGPHSSTRLGLLKTKDRPTPPQIKDFVKARLPFATRLVPVQRSPVSEDWEVFA